jgi:hypothetical protein
MRSENGVQRSRLRQILSVLRRRLPRGARATQRGEMNPLKTVQQTVVFEKDF